MRGTEVSDSCLDRRGYGGTLYWLSNGHGDLFDVSKTNSEEPKSRLCSKLTSREKDGFWSRAPLGGARNPPKLPVQYADLTYIKNVQGDDLIDECELFMSDERKIGPSLSSPVFRRGST